MKIRRWRVLHYIRMLRTRGGLKNHPRGYYLAPNCQSGLRLPTQNSLFTEKIAPNCHDLYIHPGDSQFLGWACNIERSCCRLTEPNSMCKAECSALLHTTITSQQLCNGLDIKAPQWIYCFEKAPFEQMDSSNHGPYHGGWHPGSDPYSGPSPHSLGKW